MTNENNPNSSGKVTLDIEVKDLLNIVSSNRAPVLSDHSDSHKWDSEDLKKAWFNHMLVSMEKLNDLIESVRRVDIVNLRSELKEEIKRVETKIDKVEDSLKFHKQSAENKATKTEDEFKLYKKDVIKPLQDKVLTLTIKLGVWSTIAGIVGSGVAIIVWHLIKVYVLKTAN
jgi:hypothetical protein